VHDGSPGDAEEISGCTLAASMSGTTSPTWYSRPRSVIVELRTFRKRACLKRLSSNAETLRDVLRLRSRPGRGEADDPVQFLSELRFDRELIHRVVPLDPSELPQLGPLATLDSEWQNTIL
jgi:hypothetical protein